MTVEEAAKSLQQQLQHASWLTAVGVGEEADHPCIVVYTKSPRAAKSEFKLSEWHGYPVILRKMAYPRLVNRL